FLLPAAWTALQEKLNLENFIPLLTEKPAQFLGLDHRKGRIATGYDADFVIWAPDETFVVSENAVFHKHKITPYLNRQLSGVVKQTFVNGYKVFDHNQFHQKNEGKIILQKW